MWGSPRWEDRGVDDVDFHKKWFLRLGLLLLVFVVIYLFLKLRALWFPVLKICAVVLTPFMIAAFITYLLHPIVEKLYENNLPRWLSVLIIYLLFFGGIGFALYKGIPAFVVQLRDLAENAPQLTNQYREWISAVQEQTSTLPAGVQNMIDEGINAIEQRLNSLLDKVLEFLMGILNSIVLIAIIPFIVFYFLKDIELLKKAVWYITPRKWRDIGICFLRDVDQSLGGYIRGQLLVCTIVGAAAALIFWFIGMNYPLLLGSIIGITNIIPYFGPIIGMLPALIIAATMSMKMVIMLLIILLLLQFLEANFLSPYIVGKSLRMHPLIIMLALLAGGEIGGIAGLILAVPLTAVLKASIAHAKNHFVSMKERSVEAVKER